MSKYATFDQASAMHEEDVEAGGLLFRVRGLTMLEVFEVEQALPALPDPEAKARVDERDVGGAVTRQSAWLSRALVNPKLTPEQVSGLRAGIATALFQRVQELSGFGRGFTQGDATEG